MKKKILLIATVLSLISILTIGTLAYFTAEEKASNVITSGNINIELQEKMLDPDSGEEIDFPENGIVGAMPGDEISKIVRVKNIGDNDAYIRMKVESTVNDESGGILDTNPILLDLNATDWTLKDGYYYYNEILKNGEMSEPLFTTVTFDGDTMNNDYKNSRVSIEVTAYAVQSANNGSTVLDAVGWP